jgi:predicted O-methyltransferase YrrM
LTTCRRCRPAYWEAHGSSGPAWRAGALGGTLRGAARGDRRPRPAAPGLERGHQPERHPRSGAIAREHVLDSLTALPILRRAGIEEFLDIGSGGGYPGLPLAVALPARRALLVESIGKKARFLATAR